jgi:antitoxin ParD1/3/4
VVREALRLLEERDQLRELKLEELRKFVAVGIEQADRGEVAPLDMDATLARVGSRKAKNPKGS